MRVLVIEDSLSWQEVFSAICQHEGWDAILVDSIEGAIQMLTFANPDAAIVDLMLPDATDAETTTELLESLAVRLGGRVCVVSGVESLPSTLAGVRAIRKSADFEAISQAIREALGGGPAG